MGTDKRISIIIPSYNSEKTLVKTLSSICSQTNENDEIIIVDDGSFDESRSIGRHFANKHSDKIKFIENNHNYGPSYSRNVGIEVAKGEYICFVDSDDILAPNALEIMYCFIKDNNCDIVQTGHYFVDGKELLRKRKNIKVYAEGQVLSRSEAIRSLITNDFISNFVWGKLYNIEIVKNKKFKEHIHIGEDIIWQHSVINEANRIGVLSTPLYYYIQTSDGLSLNLTPRHTGILDAHMERLNFLKKNYPKLVNDQLKVFWQIAFNFYIISQNSDPKLKNLFSQYFEKINKELCNEFDESLKYNPEYFFYKINPNLMNLYKKISRVFSYATRILGYDKYERIALP